MNNVLPADILALKFGELYYFPEIIFSYYSVLFCLSGGALFILILDFFLKEKRSLTFFALVTLFLSGYFLYNNLWLPTTLAPSGVLADTFSMFKMDTYSHYFTAFGLLAGVLLIFGGMTFVRREKIPQGEYLALILFCISGVHIFVSSTNLLMIFLGLEILSVSLYFLAGINKKSEKGAEAALKYFLNGAYAAGFFLLGTGLLYGLTGTLELEEISYRLKFLPGEAGLPTGFILLAFLALVLSIGFKVSLVPFHLWTPDVYEGSPTPIAGLMSILPKMSGILVFTRILEGFPPPGRYDTQFGLTLIAVLSTLTFIYANTLFS